MCKYEYIWVYAKNVNTHTHTHTPTLINYPSSTITFNLHPAPRAPTNAVERENRGSRRNTCLSRKTRVHFSATRRPLRILYYHNSIVYTVSKANIEQHHWLCIQHICVIYYIYIMCLDVCLAAYMRSGVCFNNLYKRWTLRMTRLCASIVSNDAHIPVVIIVVVVSSTIFREARTQCRAQHTEIHALYTHL